MKKRFSVRLKRLSPDNEKRFFSLYPRVYSIARKNHSLHCQNSALTLVQIAGQEA
jgi:hypothetical protein